MYEITFLVKTGYADILLSSLEEGETATFEWIDYDQVWPDGFFRIRLRARAPGKIIQELTEEFDAQIRIVARELVS